MRLCRNFPKFWCSWVFYHAPPASWSSRILLRERTVERSEKRGQFNYVRDEILLSEDRKMQSISVIVRLPWIQNHSNYLRNLWNFPFSAGYNQNEKKGFRFFLPRPTQLEKKSNSTEDDCSENKKRWLRSTLMMQTETQKNSNVFVLHLFSICSNGVCTVGASHWEIIAQ